MPNKWLTHVKKVKSQNPSLSLKDVLKKAKMSYTQMKATPSKAKKAPKGRKKKGDVDFGNIMI